MPGMDIGFRVQANRERVDVVYVESARGLPVLRFDSSMNPTVTRDFYPYLVGDKVDVGGDIKQTIRRPSGASPKRTGSELPLCAEPPPLSGNTEFRSCSLSTEDLLGDSSDTYPPTEVPSMGTKCVAALLQ